MQNRRLTRPQEGNLYVGTSAAEVLHYVSLPESSSDSSSNSTFILASRIEPSPHNAQANTLKGVQQIVILPRSGKACILCNGTLTFHSLPELSPAVGRGKVSNCTWIGGKNLDAQFDEQIGGGRRVSEEGDIIMIATEKRIRLVKIGDEVQLVKNVEYPGCLDATRRSRFACVADAHSYALLDVDNQQKITLFPISSSNTTATLIQTGQIENVAGPSSPPVSRSASAANRCDDPGNSEKGHSRATSLGAFVSGMKMRQPSPASRSRDGSGLSSPGAESGSRSPNRPGSHVGSPRAISPNKPLPPPPEESYAKAQLEKSSQNLALLKPNILSPIPSEFLLTTGTTTNDPGVGIFVNCDGDVVRGTLEFSNYPISVIIDGGDVSTVSKSGILEEDNDGYVLAAISGAPHEGKQGGIEIQRWDVAGQSKAWLELDSNSVSAINNENLNGSYIKNIGITKVETSTSLYLPEVGEKLRSKRFRLRHSTGANIPKSDDSQRHDAARNIQEDDFARRLGQCIGNIAAWSGNCIHWVVRSPVVMKLDYLIDQILDDSLDSRLDQAHLVAILKSIENQEAKSETEFLGLEYIRQKITTILFADLAINRYDVNPQITEQLLLEGGTDPRVILSMIPLLQKDIIEGPSGIWIYAGLVKLMEENFSSTAVNLDSDEVLSRPEDYDTLGLLKRYLTAWRQRKGFGSISDEAQVSASVDAALLHLLLYQDQQSHLGPGGSPSIRAELFAIVDNNLNCFERAIDLLEESHRLYVLSRLYQSRRMSAKVLETWRRILEGEQDDGGEFSDGEFEVRKYLAKRGNTALIEEYGTWLARRNPPLGVQVFTDEGSKVKLPPNQVVQLLRLRAPGSVKAYLEHLVFGKKNVQYANDLITYYLDNVINVLESSDEAKGILSRSYQTYRALQAPKPTYRQFITDNAISASWWHDRLRLLELLGGSYGAGFSYDVPRVLERIEPFEESLVPESIILEGKQGRHQQALHLLTHGLGDYHTATSYCLLGGSSIFHPVSGSPDPQSAPAREEQSKLFRHLFVEFLHLNDAEDRIERTSELLGRFGSWFDVLHVLNELPESWSVQTIADFLVGALRKSTLEKNETMIYKALSGAENLTISEEFVEKCEGLGPHIIPAMDTPTSM